MYLVMSSSLFLASSSDNVNSSSTLYVPSTMKIYKWRQKYWHRPKCLFVYNTDRQMFHCESWRKSSFISSVTHLPYCADRVAPGISCCYCHQILPFPIHIKSCCSSVERGKISSLQPDWGNRPLGTGMHEPTPSPTLHTQEAKIPRLRQRHNKVI